MPVSTNDQPAPKWQHLGEAFHDEVRPAEFPELVLRYRNQRWAERVGLAELTAPEWREAFGLFAPLPRNLAGPLALRYHGHQFRVYNAALGDGRGFLYAQLRDDRGRLLDLATKGSGQTPWSRGGDGRLTLKGGVREILATEMLEAIGVNTSKTFSVFETGESLSRNDEPSPTRSCVLVRLGHCHIRFGSFQRHAHRRDLRSLEQLVESSLQHYAPGLCHAGDHGARMLLQLVVTRSAQLCASWMAAGFVHGVLNTDNMNITGESFDYGPYRFLPTLDPAFTAAYFDHGGLYCYGNQPATVHWNLMQLAEALDPLASGPLFDAADEFSNTFEDALDREVVRRLGLQSQGRDADHRLRKDVFAFLHQSQIGFEQLFFDWYGGRAAAERAAQSPAARLYEGGGSRHLADLRNYSPRDGARLDHAYFQGRNPCTLLIDEIESIWNSIAEADDWSALDAKLEQIDVMRGALADPD